MGLGLEVVGAVVEVRPGERAPSTPTHEVTRLRSSHHAIARLDAKGLAPMEISAQTGVSYVRIETLRQCPTYRDLVAHYRRDADQVAQMVEAKFQLIAEDAAQVIHERILDADASMSLEEAVNVFKVFADRAGFAPVQRTVNKNVNLNIGARLDAARARKQEVIDG